MLQQQSGPHISLRGNSLILCWRAHTETKAQASKRTPVENTMRCPAPLKFLWLTSKMKAMIQRCNPSHLKAWGIGSYSLAMLFTARPCCCMISCLCWHNSYVCGYNPGRVLYVAASVETASLDFSCCSGCGTTSRDFPLIGIPNTLLRPIHVMR